MITPAHRRLTHHFQYLLCLAPCVGWPALCQCHRILPFHAWLLAASARLYISRLWTKVPNLRACGVDAEWRQVDEGQASAPGRRMADRMMNGVRPHDTARWRHDWPAVRAKSSLGTKLRLRTRHAMPAHAGPAEERSI